MDNISYLLVKSSRFLKRPWTHGCFSTTSLPGSSPSCTKSR